MKVPKPPAYWTVSANNPLGAPGATRLDGWSISLSVTPADPNDPAHPDLGGMPALGASAGWAFGPISALASLYQQAGVAPVAPVGAPKEVGTALAAGRMPYTAVAALQRWMQEHLIEGSPPPTPIFGAAITKRRDPLPNPPLVFLPGPTFLDAMRQADLLVPVPPWFPAPEPGWALAGEARRPAKSAAVAAEAPLPAEETLSQLVTLVPVVHCDLGGGIWAYDFVFPPECAARTCLDLWATHRDAPGAGAGVLALTLRQRNAPADRPVSHQSRSLAFPLPLYDLAGVEIRVLVWSTYTGGTRESLEVSARLTLP